MIARLSSSVHLSCASSRIDHSYWVCTALIFCCILGSFPPNSTSASLVSLFRFTSPLARSFAAYMDLYSEYLEGSFPYGSSRASGRYPTKYSKSPCHRLIESRSLSPGEVRAGCRLVENASPNSPILQSVNFQSRASHNKRPKSLQ